MKIEKVTIQNYRAFPFSDEFILDGKNLLILGENGSGKSSLYKALCNIFDTSPSPNHISKYKNIFYQSNTSKVLVTIDGTDYVWDNVTRPPVTGIWGECANRFCSIDYREMLKVNFINDDKINLYNLLIRNILKNMKIPWDGGALISIAEAENKMDIMKPQRRTKWNIYHAEEYAKRFYEALKFALPEVQKKSNEILSDFGNLGIKIEISPSLISYCKVRNGFFDKFIELKVTYKGKELDIPQLYLNEARLSAIAISIFMASRLVTIPPRPLPNSPSYLKLLVLDDALIGLDLEHRLPLIKILGKFFNDWQIIVLTYDTIWYEMIKSYTLASGDWITCKIIAKNGNTTCPDIPQIITEKSDYISIASKHLKCNDLRAAAVYIRIAYESRLKNICEKRGIEVKYRSDPKDISSDDLWQGIIKRQKKRISGSKGAFIDNALQNDIETVRSTVLNRLSHSGTSSLNYTEVSFALDVIRRFQNATIK